MSTNQNYPYNEGASCGAGHGADTNISAASARDAASSEAAVATTTTTTAAAAANSTKNHSASSLQRNCQAVVISMGEIFGEFGIEIYEDGCLIPLPLQTQKSIHYNPSKSDAAYVPMNAISATGAVGTHSKDFLSEYVGSKWHLYVYSEDPKSSLRLTDEGEADEELIKSDNHDVLFDQELSLSQPRKVIKLEGGKHYWARVRFYDKDNSTWSSWSAPVHTVSQYPVAVRVSEIGEDFVRILWDRPPRDTTNIFSDRNADATNAVADIEGFELRLVREEDMAQDYLETFPSGIRSHAIHGLKPGTPYIVFVRYQTLIKTVKNWKEAFRFYTEAALEVKLLTRAENVFSVQWTRGSLPQSAVGHVLPKTNVLKYEVSVEGDGLTLNPEVVPVTQDSYRLDNLEPGGTYLFYVRSLTEEGRWGSRSSPFKIRTADSPEVSVVAIGETFLSFSWSRFHEEPIETEVEYCIQNISSSYKQQRVISLCGDDKKVFHAQSLTAGTAYMVSIRTFLDGEWGMWTEPKQFSTTHKASLSFLERGEDFFTLNWPVNQLSPDPDTDEEARYNVVVAKLGKNGERAEILNEDIHRHLDEPGFRVSNLQSDSMYEVKCRLWQHNKVTGFEGWGEFSSPVKTQTLESVSLRIWDLGEDFAYVEWKRGLSDKSGVDKESWATLKYEVVVGCLDSNEDNVMHTQVVETSYTITNLKPATTYVISVRACDEKDQWGLWSKITVRTLASITTSIHEIGEDFVRVMWQRKLVDEDLHGAKSADLFVSKYSVFVYSKEMLDQEQVVHTESGYPAGGNAEVAKHLRISSEHTSLRIDELLPDREYVVAVRASTATSRWGLWSEPIRFRTNPQFRIPANNLSIGENYVNLVWSRDENPSVEEGVLLGNMTVTGQQLRVNGVDTRYSKDHTLAADIRELKVYGLSPATAYTIQLRVCGKSGSWGLWSSPVYILTRGTILTKAVEVAEDYALISWERRKVPNPKGYPTGRGLVTSYHLRVYNSISIHAETFLTDVDCPYRVTGLKPDTYYCVELKANYNDEEWGLWSTPLWCLTMKSLEVQTKLISEEFCRLSITRPPQHKRLPEDDSNRVTHDKVISFGQFRPTLMLCVTTPAVTQAPHTSTGNTKPKHQNASLPPNTDNHRLIYQTEIISATDTTEHTVPNLKSNMVYSVSVRSKLPNGDWGMWAASKLFATVPPTCICFTDIGESFVSVEWKRDPQVIPPFIKHPENVALGLGAIGASRVKIRELGGSFQQTVEIQNSSTICRINKLIPCTTYAVSVQTYNDNYAWGAWCQEGKVRTVPGLMIYLQHIAEDAAWISWTRKIDLDDMVDMDTALNSNVIAKAYEVCITGEGNFRYAKELDSTTLFFRGLEPDSIYTVHVRAQSRETDEWGEWSSKIFRTKPLLRVTFGNIGEHFAMVEWRRHLPRAITHTNLPLSSIAETDDIIQQFRLKVQRVGDPSACVYDLSPNISNFFLKDLLPSAEYRVWICSKGYEGVWGLWNDEIRVRTLPKLEVNITDIGEDYVKVLWNRSAWKGETADPVEGVEVREVDGAVSGYRVRVLDSNGETVVTQDVSFKETTCTLSHLNLSSLYSVEVSAKDTYNEWGLWSEPKRFVTLEEAQIEVMRIGENFVDVQWGRRGRFLNTRNDEEGDEEEEKMTDEEYEENDEEDGSGLLDNSPKEDDFGGAFEPFLNEPVEWPEDAIRGDEKVQQWHLRILGKRIFAGMPASEGCFEFFADGDELWKCISQLVPNSSYTISIRALNSGGEWGHWSAPLSVETFPLLEITIDNISETYIKLSWERLVVAKKGFSHTVCFPAESAIHNYQVNIQPLSTEPPFNESDEPLVAGARVYETTQPSIRLGNLLPGTRYRIYVREQLLSEDENPTEVNWGCFSDIKMVQTVSSIKVFPLEIGEDYCFVEWKRMQRPADEDVQVGIATSLFKTPEYTLHIMRLQADGETPIEGPQGMDIMRVLSSASQSFHITDLISQGIYGVRVRARAEGGHWGPWSALTKFVTQSRLQIRISSVCETNIGIEWRRSPPKWLCSPDEQEHIAATATSSTTSEALANPGANSAMNNVSGGEAIEPESAPRAESTKPTYSDIIVGENNVAQFEVKIEGISCSFNRCLHFDGTVSTTRLNGLQHDNIYAVWVRSLSQRKQWSSDSKKESVLTLSPVTAEVANCTENLLTVRWFRYSQCIRQFTTLLSEHRTEVERFCDERERKDLFDLKKKMHDMEASGEHTVTGWADQETRQLWNEERRLEALYHLRDENVHIGDPSSTGYQLQIYGTDNSTPFIRGIDSLRLKDSTEERRRDINSRKGPSKRRLEALQSQQNIAANNSEADASNLNEDGGALLDVCLRGDVQYVNVEGLKSSTAYEFMVRGRSLDQEWEPWSEMRKIITLDPLILDQSRFGEHYINLYWHRMDFDERRRRRTMYKDLEDLNEECKDFSAQHLVQLKEQNRLREYDRVLDLLKRRRELTRKTNEEQKSLEDGLGKVVVHEKTPIKYFHLRLIDENGNYQEYQVENKDDKSHAFTIRDLTPNKMYVVLMSADYGLGVCGPWTEPLKFMTQNLIQLQLLYIGECFVDIEWHRAANKKLPPDDQENTLLGDLIPKEKRVYQVLIEYENPKTGETEKEEREMNARNVFRIDSLMADTKYTFSVREWDAKGDWGLWCTQKTCATLPGISVNIDDIGEDWSKISWSRRERRIDYDNDMHILQYAVETTSYYLRVEEFIEGEEKDEAAFISDSETGHQEVTEGEEGGKSNGAERATETETEPDKDEDEDEDDLQSLFPNESVAIVESGPLPPQEHPKELNRTREGRYELVEHFPQTTLAFKLEFLKPNHIYRIQIISETDGNQLGAWSSELFVLTLPKISMEAVFIDEQVIDIVWDRHPQTIPSILQGKDVRVGDYTPESFSLTLAGPMNLDLQKVFPGDVKSYHLTGLQLDALYTLRIRSQNSRQGLSLWSDSLRVVTLAPVQVWPLQIRENAIMLEWGRKKQTHEMYDTGDVDGLLQIGNPLASRFQLRVFNSEKTCLLERFFSGDVTRFMVAELTYNTAYVISVCAANDRGDWGLWSPNRCVYTMKPLSMSIAAVGEDYVRLNWHRSAPDGIQPIGEDAFNCGLLDQPETHKSVYNSIQTIITKFEISIRRRSDLEPSILTLPGEAFLFTATNLRPDSQYSVAVRACYGEENDWGPWSSTVETGTYNLLSIEVRSVGEDYFAAAWQRRTNTRDVHKLQLGVAEDTICYEMAVYDFTTVPYGEENETQNPNLYLKAVFTNTKMRSGTVKELLSNHKYKVCVRRWYKPLEAYCSHHSSCYPDADDEVIRESILNARAVPGVWSEPDYTVTLRDMVCAVDDITEEYFNVRWERDPRCATLTFRTTIQHKPPENYQVRIDEMISDGSAISTLSDSLHVDQLMDPSESKYVAQSLKPDTLYRIDVRCCVDKVWGRWSRATYVITLPKLSVDVICIGEDFSSLVWKRHYRYLTLSDNTEAIVGSDENSEKYQLEISGVGVSYQLSKKFKGSRTSYLVKHLEANSIYSVSVRSCDGLRGSWSLWSDSVSFVTLKPLRLQVGMTGEHFAYAEWHREDQAAEEYAEQVEGTVRIGDPSVIAFHLCIFNTQETPSVAVMDKQFRPDVYRYRVTSLLPDTPYVAIVRACSQQSKWGLWSEEKAFRTKRLLGLHVDAVGECYAMCSCDREDAESNLSGDASNSGEVKKLQVILKTGATIEDRTFLVSEGKVHANHNALNLPSYCIRGLQPGSHYSVSIRPCYSDDDWGLWSPAVKLTTLSSLVVTVTQIETDRVELTWCRSGMGTEEKAAPEPIEGGTEEITTERSGLVTKYHLILCKEEDRGKIVIPIGEGRRINSSRDGNNGREQANGQFSRMKSFIPDADSDSSLDNLQAPNHEMEVSNSAKDNMGSEDERSNHSTSFEGIFKFEREIEVDKTHNSQISYLIDSLFPDTAYVVLVRAQDRYGKWGDFVEQHIQTPPVAPRNVFLRRVNAQYCSLQWEAPNGNPGLYRFVAEQMYTGMAAAALNDRKKNAKDVPDEWRATDAVETTTCPIRITGPLTKLRCRVKCARRGEGNPYSEYSEAVSLSSGTPPEHVTGLAVTSLSRSSATLEWLPPSASEKQRLLYRIYFSAKDHPPMLLTTTPSVSHTLSDLEPSTEYTAQIVAESSDGMSCQNPMIRFTTKADQDRTISVAERGLPPLGLLIDPLTALKGSDGSFLPDIPSARGLSALHESGNESNSPGTRKGSRKKRKSSARRKSKGKRRSKVSRKSRSKSRSRSRSKSRSKSRSRSRSGGKKLPAIN